MVTYSKSHVKMLLDYRKILFYLKLFYQIECKVFYKEA